MPASPDLPAVERAVLDHWTADKTFEASVEARPAGQDGSNEYVFYDGPPFANGLPHYGHLFTGYVKDLVPRYQTMRGKRVERRFGWDTHGLPAEVEAEKQLGITTKAQILELGVDKFNEACRTSVLAYTKDWERYVTRQARWVDFGNDYKTLDTDYMESVLWAFKTLHDKGLVYEGFRVLAYCFRCETPLSNTETRMDDVYRDRTDPALTVTFQLETGEKIAVWTTTPWTLPSNLALAVGPDIEYAILEKDGEKLILGAGRVPAYAKELEGFEQVGTVLGRDLAGRRYTPLFDFLVEQAGPNAFQVLAADYVTTEDGTGVVHQAPAFGEDDQTVCNAAQHPDDRDRRRAHPVHRARARLPGRSGLRRQQGDHRGAQGPRRRAAPRRIHPLVPALLALRHAAGLQGRELLVRRGQHVPGPDGRAQPGDHLDAVAHQGWLVRQVAGERPRLVDQPQPVLGLADPGVEVRRPELPAGRRVRVAGRHGA
nr:hypothetical protein GCM10020092_092180 [Actinoplanes digitatis]